MKDREAKAGVVLRDAYQEVDADDPVAYVGEIGDAVQALVYSFLFWPKLVEFHGAVFVALWGDDEEYISGRLTTPAPIRGGCPMTWADAVQSFNRFEVQQLFRQFRGSWETSGEAHLQLANVLIEVWNARLRSAYPRRSFRVLLIEGDEDMGTRIEISQEHPPLRPPEGWSDERRAIINPA